MTTKKRLMKKSYYLRILAVLIICVIGSILSSSLVVSLLTTRNMLKNINEVSNKKSEQALQYLNDSFCKMDDVLLNYTGNKNFAKLKDYSHFEEMPLSFRLELIETIKQMNQNLPEGCRAFLYWNNPQYVITAGGNIPVAVFAYEYSIGSSQGGESIVNLMESLKNINVLSFVNVFGQDKLMRAVPLTDGAKESYGLLCVETDIDEFCKAHSLDFLLQDNFFIYQNGELIYSFCKEEQIKEILSRCVETPSVSFRKGGTTYYLLNYQSQNSKVSYYYLAQVDTSRYAVNVWPILFGCDILKCTPCQGQF